MFKEISEEIRKTISNYSKEDQIVFNNKIININQDNFNEIVPNYNKTIAFVDGGQAEIISTGNFCLSFIRIFAQVFQDAGRSQISGMPETQNVSEHNQKLKSYKKEFYLFTKAKYQNEDLVYESKIFGDKNIDENDLLISSNDSTIKSGIERAPINKVVNIARRFAELNLAAEIDAEIIILDGTLEPSYNHEEKYLTNLDNNVAALAKSSSLFTSSGNSPVVLLNKLQPGKWSYFVDGKTYFVKLHEKSKHVFRYEGKKEYLSFLVENCNDALFLGYPYGLIFVDRMARVSNSEKNSLKMKFLLNKENKEVVDYLTTSNAHEILDNLG
jgi:hypothetical protein